MSHDSYIQHNVVSPNENIINDMFEELKNADDAFFVMMNYVSKRNN